MAMTGQDPKDTYLDILWVDNTNLGIPPASTVTVKSGGGNASLLALSQAEIEFLGILSATVASGVVLETGIALEADAVTVESVLDKNDPTVGVFFTTGSPEGVLTAGIGSLALREDGGAGTTVYIKESGTGNTGWKAFNVIASFTDLDDVPGTYVPSKYLKVNGAGTAIEFVDAPAVSFLDLSDTDPTDYVGATGKLVGVNATVDGLDFVDPPGGAFITLTDAPTSYTNMEGTLVRVNAAPDGLEFLDGAQGDILYHNGTAWTALTAGTSGYVLKTQGAGANPIWATEGAGVSTFIDLTDTDPTTYTAMGGNLVRVNSTPNGLEFFGGVQGDILYHNGTAWTALTAGTNGYFLKTQGAAANPVWAEIATTFIALSDTDPTAYTDAAGFVVRVNAGEDGLEFHELGILDLDGAPASYGGENDVVISTGTAFAMQTIQHLLGTIDNANLAANKCLVRNATDTDYAWQDRAFNKAYATTEFNTGDTWRGKPIYAIVVNFGIGPTDIEGEKSVASGLGVNDVYSIVDIQVMANNESEGWLGSSFADNTASFVYNKLDYKVYCVVDTGIDLSGNTYEVLLKYIKEPPTMSGTNPHVIATIAGASWGGLAQGVHVLTADTYNFAYTGTYDAPGILSFTWKATPDPTGYANHKFWLMATADATSRKSYGLLRTGTGTTNTNKIDFTWVGTGWVSPYTKGIGPGDDLFAAYTVGSLTLTIARASDFPLKPALA